MLVVGGGLGAGSGRRDLVLVGGGGGGARWWKGQRDPVLEVGGGVVRWRRCGWGSEYETETLAPVVKRAET